MISQAITSTLFSSSVQLFLNSLIAIVVPLAIPFALYLAWAGLGILKAHGYRTTYLAALLRAVGQAQIAAQRQGLSLFTPAGEQVGLAAGLAYMESTVAPQALALGIDSAGTLQRITAQIGYVKATADATAVAALTVNSPAAAAMAGIVDNTKGAAADLVSRATGIDVGNLRLPQNPAVVIAAPIGAAIGASVAAADLGTQPPLA